MTSGIEKAPAPASSAHASVAPAAGHQAYWPRVVFWTVLFQIAWNWRSLPRVLLEGAMPDNDDFQRLQQVRDWMGGQGWYDLVQHRMDPPLGADMHWSRLVDVPIAVLMSLFGLFTDPVTAGRLAAIVWPTLLLVAVVLVVVAICRSIVERFDPLLAVLFTVTCVTALTEFAPGRIDHHSVQILFFCLTLLGLANAGTWWGHLLAGATMAASISIGLDAILLIVLMLAWLGLEWALMRDPDGRGLVRTGIGMALASLALFPLNFAPSQWLAAHCDANSIVYLAALWAIATAFGLLAFASPLLTGTTAPRTIAIRLGAGTVLGLATAGLLYLIFPQCAGGPYASISPELATRWMVNIDEAMGLFARMGNFPELWLSGLAYSLVLVGVGAAVVRRLGASRPAVIPLFATLVLSFLASLIQYRAMRIGVFAAIPLCVAFAGLGWQWLTARLPDRRPAAFAAQALLVATMLSPVWLVAGKALFPDPRLARQTASAPGAAAAGVDIPEWKTRDFYLFCNERSQYRALAALPAGHVMSDLNSGPEILAFTGHSVVGGPYHRNERAILDMLDFFESDLENPRRIAAWHGIDYVAWCNPGDLDGARYDASRALAARLARGKTPEWLENLSPAGDRLQIYRVRR